MGWRDRLAGREDNPCTHPGAGKYCADCGKLRQPPRYSLDEMLGNQSEVWLERGFRRTLIGLFTHPGQAIRIFLFQDRNHLIKPLAYLVLALAFSIWVDNLFVEDTTCAPDDAVCKLLAEDMLTLQMIQIGIYTILYRLAFRRTGLNLWEYGVGFAYIVAQSFILSAVLTLAFAWLGSGWRDGLSLTGTILYVISAAILLLQLRGPRQIIAGVLLGVFAVLLFVLVVVVIMLGVTAAELPLPPA